MKNVMMTILLSFLFLGFNNSVTAKDITDVSHLELIETLIVNADANVINPVIVDELDVDQKYLLAIIGGDGISIWNVGPLTRTCHGRFKVNRLVWGDNVVILFSLNGFGNSLDAQSFYTFTPLGEDDRVELYISDEAPADNRGWVEVGLFKVLKQLKNLNRGVKD